MAEAKKLGELLKEAGMIDDFQLQSALSHQRNWGGKLGNILVEMEFVRENDLSRLISEKLRIPYINLFEPEIPESVIRLIKPEIARKYLAIPARKDKGMLVLAMSDPLDIEAIDEIRFITGLTIRPALAMKAEIQDAIKKYYDGEDIVRKRQAPLPPPTSFPGGDKMEIVRGVDMLTPPVRPSAPPPTGSPILSKDEAIAQAIQDQKIRIESLIALLIEKRLISREELVSMIYQKKMGL